MATTDGTIAICPPLQTIVGQVHAIRCLKRTFCFVDVTATGSLRECACTQVVIQQHDLCSSSEDGWPSVAEMMTLLQYDVSLGDELRVQGYEPNETESYASTNSFGVTKRNFTAVRLQRIRTWASLAPMPLHSCSECAIDTCTAGAPLETTAHCKYDTWLATARAAAGIMPLERRSIAQASSRARRANGDHSRLERVVYGIPIHRLCRHIFSSDGSTCTRAHCDAEHDYRNFVGIASMRALLRDPTATIAAREPSDELPSAPLHVALREPCLRAPSCTFSRTLAAADYCDGCLLRFFHALVHKAVSDFRHDRRVASTLRFSHDDTAERLPHCARAHAFVKWLVANVPASILRRGVCDVAGGSGSVSNLLALEHGIACTIVDARAAKRCKRTDNLFARCPAAPRPRYIQAWFSSDSMSADVSEAVRSAGMLIGLHADQATEAIVDVALSNNKPFAVVPCCVFGRLFPHRRRMDGSPVHSYVDFVRYLVEKGCEAQDVPAVTSRVVHAADAADASRETSDAPVDSSDGAHGHACSTAEADLLQQYAQDASRGASRISFLGCDGANVVVFGGHGEAWGAAPASGEGPDLLKIPS